MPTPTDGVAWTSGTDDLTTAANARALAQLAVPPVTVAAPWGAGNYRPLQSAPVAGTAALTNNREYAVAFVVAAPVTLARIGIEVTSAGAASSKIRLGIREDNGYGHPANSAPLLDSGVTGTASTILGTGFIDATNVSAQEITISLALLPGRIYWATCTAQGGTPTVRTSQGMVVAIDYGSTISLVTGSNCILAHIQESVSGALPSTFTTTVSGAFTAPRIFGRAA